MRPLKTIALLLAMTYMASGKAVSPPANRLAPRDDQKPIAIVHARIVDGNGKEPIEDGILIIQGGQIQAVGPASQVAVPPGALVIDVHGKTAMPGLADMHVHLVGGWDGYATDLLSFPRYLNGLLYAGVTTVMDTGNVQPFVLQLRQETAAGRLMGPRIYCAGSLIDGPYPIWPPISFVLTSPAQVPSLVRRQKADGVDVIKAYVGLPLATVEALCREADKVNLPVFIDQGFRNGSVDLVHAGITAFAHLPTMPVTDLMLDAYKAKPTRFMSTLSVYEWNSRRRLSDLAFLNNDLYRNTMPSWFIDGVRHEAQRSLTSTELKRATLWGDRLKEAERSAKKLLDAHILLAAGTDAPYPGDSLGEGLHRELELLVEAGFTPLQAISAATKNAALLVNAGAEWGTLEKGKRADVLIIDGRPDRRVSDTRRIDMVIQKGRILDRRRLRFDPRRDIWFRVQGQAAAGGN